MNRKAHFCYAKSFTPHFQYWRLFSIYQILHFVVLLEYNYSLRNLCLEKIKKYF